MEENRIAMPVIALRGMTVLPGMMIHFDVSRSRSIAAAEKAMVTDQKVFLTAQKDPDVLEPELEDLYAAGTIAKVRQLVKMQGNVTRVMVEGLEKAELLGLQSTEPMLVGEILPVQDQEEELDYAAKEAMVRILKEKLEEYSLDHPKLARDVLPGMIITQDLERLMRQISLQLPWDYQVRQAVLEAPGITERYEVLVRSLLMENEVGRVKREFQAKVKAGIDKNQKEYILREQLRVIREELGEDSPSSEADGYLEQLAKLKADKETKEKLEKEIQRFRAMPGGSQEANVLRTYIETLLELPWKKVSKDNNDIRHAEEILNEDHYGLEKVKERVLEYLAVRTLSKKGNGRFCAWWDRREPAKPPLPGR